MPPAKPAPEPQAPPAPPEGQDKGGEGKPVDDRLSAIEDRQDRQEGLLHQILERLPGKNPSSGSTASTAAPGPDEGKPIAELVREGVERLEAEKQAKAAKESEAAERKNHADRIRKLEEARPREAPATPAGKFRAAVQKYGFGITEGR